MGEPKVQFLRPYYMKMHDGVVHVFAVVGNVPVVVKVKTSEITGGIHAQFVKTLVAAQVKIEPVTRPIVSRVSPAWDSAVGRVDRFTVSVKEGMFCVSAAVADRKVYVTGKLEEIVGAMRTRANGGLSSVRTGISDLTSQLVDMVSKIYGRTDERVRLLYTSFRDGVFEIAGQVKNRSFILKAKVSDLKQLIESTGRQICKTSYADLKEKLQQVTEIAKAKSSDAKDNLRSLAGNEKAKATVASAAGGAVVLGASGGAVGTGLGVVFAPFTLGLSIPVGLCLGTAAGGTAGLLTGGAAGYHKESIGNGVNAGFSKVKEYKSMAANSTTKLSRKSKSWQVQAAPLLEMLGTTSAVMGISGSCLFPLLFLTYRYLPCLAQARRLYELCKGVFFFISSYSLA